MVTGLDPNNRYKIDPYVYKPNNILYVPPGGGPSPPPTPPPPALPPPVAPIDPAEFNVALYDKEAPVALGGRLQFGGRIIEGPVFGVVDNETVVSFIVGYYIPVNFWSATRTVTKLSFRGKEAWDSTSGTSMSGLYVGVATTSNRQTVRFTTGTLTQAADAWSISKFGSSNAVGYIPMVTGTFENIRLAQFNGIIPFTSVTVEDTYFGDPADNVLWSEALDAIARYDGRTTAEFESIDVTGDVAGIIFGTKLTFPEFLSGMRKHKPQWNIRTGSKLYVVEKSVFILDLTLDRSDSATWFVVENGAAPVVIHGSDSFDNPREMLANFIDVDRDYEPNVARAAEDLEPVPTTDAFDIDSYNLPIVSTTPEMLSEVNFAFYSREMAREKSEWSGQAPWLGLEPGDAYKIVTDEQDYFHRANEIVRKANYQIDVKGEGFLTCAIAENDPLFAHVILLCGFDGGYVDESSYGLTVTGSGTVAIGAPMFGTGSAAFDGVTARVTVSDPSVAVGRPVALCPNTDAEFCIELFVIFTARSTNFDMLMANSSGLGNASFEMRVNETDITELRIRFGNNGISFGYTLDTVGAGLANGVQYHVAWTHDSSDVFRVFINGVLRGTLAGAGNPTPVAGNLSGVTFGDRQLGDSPATLRIDEARVTVGAAGTGAVRYTADFTAPTAKFPRY